MGLTVIFKRSTVVHSDFVNDNGLKSGEKLFSCGEFEKCFPSEPSLSQHVNTPESEKCCVSSCDLARHRQSHSEEKQFECSLS